MLAGKNKQPPVTEATAAAAPDLSQPFPLARRSPCLAYNCIVIPVPDNGGGGGGVKSSAVARFAANVKSDLFRFISRFDFLLSVIEGCIKMDAQGICHIADLLTLHQALSLGPEPSPAPAAVRGATWRSNRGN